MNRKILNILNTTAGQLIFALAAGSAYFMVLLRVIINYSSGRTLLAWYFAPLIICGAAIIIIKLMKQAREAENEKTIIALFWLHVLLLVLGAITVIAI